MSVSELIMKVMFGVEAPPAKYWVGLARDGKEIMDPGYDRQMVLRTQWVVRDDGTANAAVGFGPFDNTVEFDATMLFAERELVDTIPVPDGPVRLTKGMFLGHSVKVAFDGGG